MTDWTPAEVAIVWLSLKVAGVATLASAIPAIGVAWLLARGRFWGRAALNVLVHLPLVVPPVVTGYLLLRVFGRRGPAGAWLEQYLGLQFSFRWTGAALAAAVDGVSPGRARSAARHRRRGSHRSKNRPPRLARTRSGCS